MEYFEDQCGDIQKWLDTKSGSSFFTEGWALYAEKPVTSDDTDTYDGYPLEKYGMLKWQVRIYAGTVCSHFLIYIQQRPILYLCTICY